MRTFVFLTLLFASGISCSLGAQEAMPATNDTNAEKTRYTPKDRISSSEYKLSNERIEKINAVLKRYYDKHVDLESKEVIDEIKNEIQKFVPLKPAQELDSRSPFAIQNSLIGKVNEKYGMTPDQIRKTAEKDAVKKYPMAKRNEVVKVHFKRGRSIHSVSGHYYGFGLGGKSVRLDSRNVPLFDMLPESKALFDQNFNAEMRKNFVNEQVREYMKQRRKYAEELFSAEYAKIRKKNEKSGYLYHSNSWEPAENVLNAGLAEMVKKAKVRAELERLEKEAKEKARKEAGGNQEKPKEDNQDEDY